LLDNALPNPSLQATAPSALSFQYGIDKREDQCKSGAAPELDAVILPSR